MTIALQDRQSLGDLFDESPNRSYSLPARAYIQPGYLSVEQHEIFYKSWQYICHIEQLLNPGDYVAFKIQDRPIIALRDRDGELRAFYNVCRHRGHELLSGEGNVKTIVCPYHAWCYDLKGGLFSARYAESIENFDYEDFSLMPVQVEEFCSMIFVNLDHTGEVLVFAFRH